jgi:hypothetical protein
MAGYTVGRTFPEGVHIEVDADGATKAVQLATRTQPPPSPTGSVSAGTAMCAIPSWLVFQRIVDIPFEVCAAALESWSWPGGHNGELLIGRSVLRGPIEHDPDSETVRIEVRLARGPLRSLLRMRLDIDRWSSSPSSTALELIPSARVRPGASYFRAGHLLLDRLTHRLRLEREIPSRSTIVAADDCSALRPEARRRGSSGGSALEALRLQPGDGCLAPGRTLANDRFLTSRWGRVRAPDR